MGLFGSTRTYVASSLYNLAGETGEERSMLRSIVVSSVLSNSPTSISENIMRNLRGGTAMSQRRFFQWARHYYDLGMPTGSLGAEISTGSTDLIPALETLIPLASGERIQVVSSRVDDPDAFYWAEDWIVTNRPNLSDDAWSVDFNLGGAEIIIEIVGETPVAIPIPIDMAWGLSDKSRKLLFVAYKILTEGSGGRTTVGPIQLFTYRIGSGNPVLDGLTFGTALMPEFFPAIPLRISNDSIREPVHDDIFPAAKKAYRKLLGAPIEDLLDQLEENESIGDMDYIYMVPGVPLKTASMAGREYLYEFFKALIPLQLSQLDTEDIRQRMKIRAKNGSQLERWLAGNSGGASVNSPSYGTPFPSLMTTLMARETTNVLTIQMEEMPEFNIQLRWTGIEESQHIGNAKRYDGNTVMPLAKRGEYWVKVTEKALPQHTGSGVFRALRNVDTNRITIFHQYAKRRYRMLVITGFEHRNHVYNDRSVITTASEALDGAEDESFLIPLHYPTLKSIGPKKAADLVQCSNYLVINTYEVVRQRWWETGFFRIILVAVSIGIAVMSGGASLAATPGILGTNAAVGMAVGASAATAALVGAVVNGIAGVILSSVIMKASTNIFGDRWGSIIGTIASFMAFQVGTQYASTGNFNVDWSQVFSAENLLNLTNSVTGAYSRWLAVDTAEIYANIEEMGEEYQEQVEEIQELTRDILGMTATDFDYMLLTDANEHFSESSESFLGRTLLTGTDIAELSRAMIENFAEISLELPRH